MKSLYILLAFILTINNSFYAQNKYIADLEKKADYNFTFGEYRLAYNSYYKLWQLDSTNIDYNYRLAICRVEENIDPAKAIPALISVRKNQPENYDALFYLARAKMLTYHFTDAMELLNIYREKSSNKVFLEQIDHLMKTCKNALEMMNNPVNVVFENLGTNINSQMDDYNPFIAQDESYILFTSNKKYDPEYGTYVNNIYMSKFKNGEWQHAKPQTKINTYDDEILLSMNPDGNKIMVCNKLDNEYSDILIAENKNMGLRYSSKYDNMFNVLNTKSEENGASMTEDENMIFISSNRPGGKGGFDIYVIRKLPDGTYGEAENLGNIINTPFDESYPVISADGQILYFASKGHNSIGGYDIFVSYWNISRRTWTKPINLGYPINTTDDNLTISFAKNNRYAYIAAKNKEGFGGKDIYRITFLDKEAECSLLKCEIFYGDSTNAEEFSGSSYDLDIAVFDNFGNIFGQYLPKKNTGKFVVILPVGDFEIEINYPGYKPLVEKLHIPGKGDFKNEYVKSFYLLPE
ncbi:MAG: hypothetical protein Kow0068_15800 [Marinilabiliales bacterium]